MFYMLLKTSYESVFRQRIAVDNVHNTSRAFQYYTQCSN